MSEAHIEKGSAMHGESGYSRIANDAYWTPAWCTQALIDCPAFTPRGLLVEPAVGKGHIADVLKSNYGSDVAESDIIDHNGGNRPHLRVADFLKFGALSLSRPSTVITNPPYTHAEEFVRHAVALTEQRRGMVAMLLRNEWDCAATRRDLFEMPCFALKLVLTRRPRWSDSKKASPRHNYAWFVFDWDHYGHAILMHDGPREAA